MNAKFRVISRKFFIIIFLVVTTSNLSRGTALSETLSVQGEKVNLRTSPDQKAKALWEYGNGFPLEILKKQGEWVFVRDFENDSGWIHKSRLQKSQSVIVKANKAEEKTINVRGSASIDSTIVATAYYGVVFTALEKKGSWLQVRHESGLTGWVKLDFVWGL